MEQKNMPTHIAIIMDGNRRWAKKRGLAPNLGHKEGAKTLKKLCKYIEKLGIPYVSVFAFSTENFKRSEEEVNGLMNLFITMFTNEFKFLLEDGVKVVFSGKRYPLSEKVLKAMDEMMEKSKNNTKYTFNVCLNYGGQDEIIDVIKKIATQVQEGSLQISDIDCDTIEQNLYQQLPPIDLLIRTSGEYRISNFMLWQMAYAEFYFTDVLFPDFDEKELDLAIQEYQKRNRRFGGA
ncbi:MAG: polyprenyl diphosphate synthase [Firmicutes bacterium]|nr:polyprenyl diphosphate synthase [Bacillota bacterium]